MRRLGALKSVEREIDEDAEQVGAGDGGVDASWKFYYA